MVIYCRRKVSNFNDSQKRRMYDFNQPLPSICSRTWKEENYHYYIQPIQWRTLKPLKQGTVVSPFIGMEENEMTLQFRL